MAGVKARKLNRSGSVPGRPAAVKLAIVAWHDLIALAQIDQSARTGYQPDGRAAAVTTETRPA